MDWLAMDWQKKHRVFSLAFSTPQCISTCIVSLNRFVDSRVIEGKGRAYIPSLALRKHGLRRRFSCFFNPASAWQSTVSHPRSFVRPWLPPFLNEASILNLQVGNASVD
jgi:hypothetical protein